MRPNLTPSSSRPTTRGSRATFRRLALAAVPLIAPLLLVTLLGACKTTEREPPPQAGLWESSLEVQRAACPEPPASARAESRSAPRPLVRRHLPEGSAGYTKDQVRAKLDEYEVAVIRKNAALEQVIGEADRCAGRSPAAARSS